MLSKRTDAYLILVTKVDRSQAQKDCISDPNVDCHDSFTSTDFTLYFVKILASHRTCSFGEKLETKKPGR